MGGAGKLPINVGDRDYQPLYPYGWSAPVMPATGTPQPAGIRPIPGIRVYGVLAPSNWRDALLRFSTPQFSAQRALSATAEASNSAPKSSHSVS